MGAKSDHFCLFAAYFNVFFPWFVGGIANMSVNIWYIGKLKNIDIDKIILENIDINIDEGIDINKAILKNIDIDKEILENIDIDKEILKSIDINKIYININFYETCEALHVVLLWK